MKKEKKDVKAKKSPSPRKPKSPTAHPSYLEMITEAITSLNERRGSSQYAITRFIEDKHACHLSPNFKKLVLVNLKKLVSSDKLVKVKSCYKLPPTKPPAPKPTVAPPAAMPKAANKLEAAAKAKSMPAAKQMPDEPATKPDSLKEIDFRRIQSDYLCCGPSRIFPLGSESD